MSYLEFSLDVAWLCNPVQNGWACLWESFLCSFATWRIRDSSLEAKLDTQKCKNTSSNLLNTREILPPLYWNDFEAHHSTCKSLCSTKPVWFQSVVTCRIRSAHCFLSRELTRLAFNSSLDVCPVEENLYLQPMICSDSYLLNVMKEISHLCTEGRIFLSAANTSWKSSKIDLHAPCFLNTLWTLFMSKERSKIDGFAAHTAGTVPMVIIDRMVLWKDAHSACYFNNCLEKTLFFRKLDVLKIR